jgi:RNA polymerase sigma-32 factor
MSLAAQNLRYAYHIADTIHRRYLWLERDDLRAEAAYGFVLAERTYDPERGVLFTTYAHSWAKNYVLRFIARNSRAVKLGNPELFWTIRRVRQGRSNAKDERLLSRKKIGEVAELLQYNSARDRSMSAPVDGEDEGYTLLDTLFDPADTERVHKLDGENFVADVVSGLGELRPIYMAILHEIILAQNPTPLQTIGERFGVSRQRVQQIQVKLVKKLAAYVQGTECPTKSSSPKSPKMK